MGGDWDELARAALKLMTAQISEQNAPDSVVLPVSLVEGDTI